MLAVNLGYLAARSWPAARVEGHSLMTLTVIFIFIVFVNKILLK